MMWFVFLQVLSHEVLIMLLEEKSTDHQSDHKGGGNVCIKLIDNTSNNCWDYSLKITNVNLMVVLGEKSGIIKVSKTQPLGIMHVCQSSCWDISSAIHRGTQLAWQKYSLHSPLQKIINVSLTNLVLYWHLYRSISHNNQWTNFEQRALVIHIMIIVYLYFVAIVRLWRWPCENSNSQV